MLVYEVTGKVVPPAGIPLDVGAAVSNAATMAAVYDAMEGRPFIRKYLTVAGAVKEPKILCVPVGTSYADCLRQAGGATEESAIAQANKISLAHMKNRAAASCIQCSYCTELCPRHLLGHPLEPHKIMRKMAISPDITQLLDDPDVGKAALCCQCGVCESYACPMGLQPRRVNALLKEALGRAGIRYPKGEGVFTPLPARKNRKVPTQRAAARAGVLDYLGTALEQMEEYRPDAVILPLNQQIGAPCQPVVQEGDQVTEGQLVAKCPDGKLGANLHASIAGTVVWTEGAIAIQERRS